MENTDLYISQKIFNPQRKGGSRLLQVWNGNRTAYLEQRIFLAAKVQETGEYFLRIDSSINICANHTMYDIYLQKGYDALVGREVKYILNTGKKQSGTIVKVPTENVLKQMPYTTRDSIMQYLSQIKSKQVQVYLEEEKKRTDDVVVFVKQFSGDVVLSYLASSLQPIISLKSLKKDKGDTLFAGTVLKHSKRNMMLRWRLDDFILLQVKGNVEELNNPVFSRTPASAEILGMEVGQLPTPTLRVGNGGTIKAISKEKGRLFPYMKYQVYPCYLPPRLSDDNKFHLTIIARKSDFVDTNDIYVFLCSYLYRNGIQFNLPHGQKVFIPKVHLLDDAQIADSVHLRARIGDILQEDGETAVLLAILPDDDSELPFDFYDTAKKRLATSDKIPSQMMTVHHARAIIHDELTERIRHQEKYTPERYQWYKDRLMNVYNRSYGNAMYMSRNLILGILAKAGAIPYALADDTGDIDLFIGIDVAKQAAGIHFPACAVSFNNKSGLRFCQPSRPISGEKIPVEDMNDLFDQLLDEYYRTQGELPKNIMILRDGFSREPLEWYQQYFTSKGIQFSLFEILKSGAPRLLRPTIFSQNQSANPTPGDVLYGKDYAYLCTTEASQKNSGAPNPIKIHYICGDVHLKEGVRLIYALTKLDVGSCWNLRLPIPIEYADSICKMREYVPFGFSDVPFFR